MKITAKQIQPNSRIKVASIYDSTEMMQGFADSENLSKEERAYYQYRIDTNRTMEVRLGSIKKSSPSLIVYSVEFDSSCSYYCNSRLVTLNSVYLHTNQGVLSIGNRQKVELID
jgi:hypothetical protein|tara:strand:- start:86 stop:427 length:342 start_codon:yes stop_codon:yes gene_type:complete